MKDTFCDNVPSYALVNCWHCEFKHGRLSVETAPRPGHPPSAIGEAPVNQVGAAIFEDQCRPIRQIVQGQGKYRVCGNYHSRSFVYAKGVCEIDFQVPHTFPEARAGRVLGDEFGDVPRRWVRLFQKTRYTG